MFSIVGLQKINYIGKGISGRNCDFTYYDQDMVKYIIQLENKENKLNKFQLELSEKYGECYSGWTTATYGMVSFIKVNEFDEPTHVPKKNFNSYIDLEVSDFSSDYECNWFSFSYEGENGYYPEGYIRVNINMFDEYTFPKIEFKSQTLKQYYQEFPKIETKFIIVGLKQHFTISGIEYIICLRKNNDKYELTLPNKEQIKVSCFGAFTHYPIGDNTDIFLGNEEEFECKWFSFNKVKLENFKKTSRGFSKHPVWIFYGRSNLGKSFLAHKLNMVVFEADSCEKLPEKIIADIVVIGNKHTHEIDDIKNRIDGQLVDVNFN